MRHIISLKEQSKEDILEILEMAIELKNMRKEGKMPVYLPQQTMIMFFEKSSTRTRLSFEAGMTELGGHAIFLDKSTSQFSLTDFRDEIQAVMRFGDILMYRAMKASSVETAASFDKIPVIDACSEKYHPAQALSDLLTMVENTAGGVENIEKVTWLGVENNVSNTLKLMCATLGIEVALATPKVDEASVDQDLNEMTEKTGKITKTLDIEEAVKGADFVHTDTWMNMEFFENGKVKPEYQTEYDQTIDKMKPYQLNAEIIDKYAPEAGIMHCMPCHIGYEISRDAVDHKNSVIYDQAENRMHMQKAMILWQLGIEL